MKRNGFEVVLLDEYNLNNPENIKLGRVLVPYNILTIRSLEPPKVGVEGTSEEYIKIVPCHPLLHLFALPRLLSKNRKEMEPEFEVVYADEDARKFCEKYKNTVFKDGFPRERFVVEIQMPKTNL